MEVYGTSRIKVDIDPKDVIRQLIDKEKGYNGWIFEENEKYYMGFEVSRCCNDKEEITKECFEYINKLQDIYKYLNQ